MTLPILIIAIIALAILTFIAILSRYKKCPSDRILVVYGKTGGGRTARCYHGGAAFIIPVIQGYKFMSLEPLQFECNLQKALSAQNIRVDVPTTVTVGISTEPSVMQNAAERILGLGSNALEDLVKDIVYGQLRLVVSNMTIEQLNADRDEFMKEVSVAVGGELSKIGLKLINLNITDIRDEAGYIIALGQKDKAIALNAANVEIAKAEKDGAIKIAEQKREQNSQVAEAQQKEAVSVATANALKDLHVAEQQKTRDISVAKSQADGEIGKIEASKTVAEKQAELNVIKATAHAKSQSAQAEAEAKIEQNKEIALKATETARAERTEAALKAAEIVPAEIAKRRNLLEAEAYQLKLEKEAEARANQKRLEAEGEASAEAQLGEGRAKAISAEGLAKAKVIEAEGLAKAKATEAELKAQADGFEAMIKAADSNPQIAIQFKMVQEGTYENIAGKQVEAFRHMNFGNVQIMDTSKGSGLTGVMQGLVSQIAPMLNVVKEMNIPRVSKALGEKVEFKNPETETE